MLFPFLISPPKTPYLWAAWPWGGAPPKTPYQIPPFPCSPTHPLPRPCPGIPLDWGIEHSQDQGPLLSLMSHKAILCYICDWSHEFHHV